MNKEFKNPRTLRAIENDPRVSEVIIDNGAEAKYWVCLKEPYYSEYTHCVSLPCRSVQEACEEMQSVVKGTLGRGGRIIEIDGE